MNYIDLTRTVSPSTPVYPGDPCPVFHKLNDLMEDGFEMYEVSSGMHVGTHLDAPMHFVKNGKRVDELDVELFIGKGYVLNLLSNQQQNLNLDPGSIALISSGHEKLWGTADYFNKYPPLSLEFAQWCIEQQVKIICVDMPSVDFAPHEIHRLLLGHGILIVENICNLAAIENLTEIEVIVTPVKYETEAAPCRVIARWE